MRAHSVTTNERARWPTPRAMNMYDMRHLAPSTGRRTTGARADVNESIRAVLLHEVALRCISARRRELHVLQIYFSLKAMTCRRNFID